MEIKDEDMTAELLNVITAYHVYGDNSPMAKVCKAILEQPWKHLIRGSDYESGRLQIWYKHHLSNSRRKILTAWYDRKEKTFKLTNRGTRFDNDLNQKVLEDGQYIQGDLKTIVEKIKECLYTKKLA